MSRNPSCLILGFALFWCAFIGMFDVMILSGVARQLLTYSYQPVSVRILSSEVSSHTDSDGDTSYKPEVTYTYSLDGRTYESSVVSHSLAFSTFETSHDMVSRHAPGSEATAYLDPEHPAAAVLQKGVSANDLLAIMFLTPFNVAGVGLLWAGLPSKRHKKTGGVAVTESVRELRAKIHATPPWVAVGASLGCGAFIGIFVVFLGAKFVPMAWLAPGVWVAILTLCAWSWISVVRQQRAGHGDMVIHKLDRTLVVWRLPLNKPETLARSALERLSLIEERRADADGDTQRKHVLKLHLRAGETLSIREASDPDSARTFATWLSQQLGIPLD